MTNAAVSEDVEQELTPEEIEREISDTDMFLGNAFRVERAGLVRAGIMVPKSGCPEDKVKKYHDLVARELSWDDIKDALGVDSRGKTWLTMKNVDYFTLRPGDCKNPQHAKLIKELYADADGKLRKIPIMFPHDDIDSIISVQLSCYTGGTRKTGRYHGDKLICEQNAGAPQPQGGGSQQTGAKKTEHRTFGPPPKIKKPCDRDACRDYQEKACTFRGGMIFRIPQVPGLGVWAIYTKSAFYAMVSLRSKLKTIQGIASDYCGLSKIPAGLFYLQKFKEKVGRERREQWLITIDSDFAVDEIEAKLAEKYSRRDIIGAAAAAVRSLNGKHGEQIDRTTGEVLGTGNVEEGRETLPAEAKTQAVAEAPPKQQPAPVGEQKPAAAESVPPGPAGPPSAAPKTGASKFNARLVSFMKGIRQNELIKHIDDMGLLQSIQTMSLKKFSKKLELLSEDEVTKIISDIREAIAKKDVSGFVPYSGGKASTSTESQKPAEAAPPVGADALGEEWPNESKTPPPSTDKAVKPAEAAENSDELFGLGPKIVPFLRGVMKNPIFAGVTSFRSTMEDYSKRAFGKNLSTLSPEEIGKFINCVQLALTKKDLSLLTGVKSAAAGAKAGDGGARVSSEAFS